MDWPKLPDRELQRANTAGRWAAAEGKPESACPFVIPALRAQWLAGWDAGQLLKAQETKP